MKYIFCLSIVFFSSYLTSFGQQQMRNLVIELPNFYRGEGVIFDDRVDLRIEIDSMLRRFTPLLEDIEQAEDVLANQYINLYKRYYEKLKRDYSLSQAELKDWEIAIDSLSRNQHKLRYYNRQYAGYIDLNGDRRIIIKLLNFKSKKKAEKNFSNWKSDYIIGFGHFYESNMFSVDVNLGKNHLRF